MNARKKEIIPYFYCFLNLKIDFRKNKINKLLEKK